MKPALFAALLAGCAIGTLKEDDPLDTASGGCTGFECTDGFLVSLVRPEWEQGTWTLVVDIADDAGSRTVTCSYAVPFGNSYEGGCDADEVLVGTSGSGADSAFYQVLLATTSATEVTLSFSRDGLPVDAETFEPDYQVEQPNGPACEPTCLSAEAVMVVGDG